MYQKEQTNTVVTFLKCPELSLSTDKTIDRVFLSKATDG